MRMLIILLLTAVPVRAEELALTLKSAESGALTVSNEYRAARLSAESASAAAAAAGALLDPRVTLEGSLRYAEVIPKMALPPLLGGAKPLGGNWNYSVGPSLYWTVFDGGVLRSGREAALKRAAASRAEEEDARRQVLLRTRTAYFRLQLALERVYLIGENLQLSMAQLADISLGAKAGTRSRLDEIRARGETLDRRRDLVRARGELASALRDLALLTGLDLPSGAALPMDSRLEGLGLEDGQNAGLYLKAEPYGQILERFLPAASAPLQKGLPAVAALDYSAGAYRALAGSYRAQRLPRLQFGARSSIDYPNGPDIYSFLQNSASLSLSLPLFEGGGSSDKARESELAAGAAAEKKTWAQLVSENQFRKALDAQTELLAEQGINKSAADDAQEAAKLAYDSYKSGGSTWLDVESADLKELQARTASASADAEILLNLALLDSLTGSVN